MEMHSVSSLVGGVSVGDVLILFTLTYTHPPKCCGGLCMTNATKDLKGYRGKHTRGGVEGHDLNTQESIILRVRGCVCVLILKHMFSRKTSIDIHNK